MTAVPPPVHAFPGPVPADQRAADNHGGSSAFQRLGFTILVLYLFLIYSRIFDVKFSYLHIPGISYRVVFAMVVLSQAFVRALKSDIGKALAGFSVWFVLAIPGSVWRGGSTALLTGTWLPSFIIFLATAGMIVNYDQCRKAVNAVAYGLLVLTVIAILYGSTEETGRLYLPQGKFSNPNEMAQALLLGLSLWWLRWLNARSVIGKAVAGVVLMVMLFTISRTGSRGAMVSFGVLLFSIFMRSSTGGKMKMLIGTVVLAALLVGTMPKRLLNRYRTLAEDQEVIATDDLDSTAYSSTAARKDLLRKSIKYTFQHPLFGVGPGMFVVAEDADAIAAGRRHGAWQGTHNSYTQVSSECGIPALIFYVLVIVFSLKKTSLIYRQTRGDPRLADIANIAVGLNYALVMYAVTVLFDYIAFTSMLSVFAGLSAALGATVEAEIARRTADAPEARPAASLSNRGLVRGFRPSMAMHFP
jgi:O-antigen ligase